MRTCCVTIGENESPAITQFIELIDLIPDFDEKSD